MFIDTSHDPGAEDELARWYESQREAWGYLPNYALAFASRPAVGLAWGRLSAAVREGMDRRRFELATIAASRVLDCTYCVAAHSLFLRDVCGDEPAMRAVAEDPTGASLDPVDRAVVAFATKVATDPVSITAEDVERLRGAGLSDADVADVIFAVAARRFFTTVLDASGAQADHQLAAAFDDDLRERLTVGRPFATAPDR